MKEPRIPVDGESNALAVKAYAETFPGNNFRAQCIASQDGVIEAMARETPGSPKWHSLSRTIQALGLLISIDQMEPISIPEMEQRQALAA